MNTEIKYPFVPKSNALLRPGQFWAVPLSNGKFACGRVLQLPPEDFRYGRKVMFFAGLMDWVSLGLPTSDSIAGSRLLRQGKAHIKTILVTGKQILGYRSLDADRINIMYETDAAGSPCNIVQGFKTIRTAKPTDFRSFGNQKCWGFRVIEIAAERAFGEGKSETFGIKSRR